MKQIAYVIAIALALSACSKQEDKTAAGNKDTAASEGAQQPVQPAADPHAGMSGMTNMGGGNAPANMGSAAAAGQAAAAAPAGNQYQGKVKNITHAAGYSYIEVENGGQSLWLASMPADVKVGDTIAWGGGAVMQNFTSNTLNRTFDQILFVDKVSKVN